MPNAACVSEGYVDPTEPLRDEGPFADPTGYYTLPSPRGIAGDTWLEAAYCGIPRGEPYPVFHVTAITHRKDAGYPATIDGASVKLFLPIFKMNFPEIVNGFQDELRAWLRKHETEWDEKYVWE